MKILRHHNDMMTDDLVVLTDESRHPLRIPRHVVDTGPSALEGYLETELAQRHAARMFRDNRHDSWKGARQPWVSA